MRTTILAPVCAGLLASACVTINVYFPAVAAERAADRIIDDVWGKEAAPQPAPAEQPEASSSSLTLDQRVVALAVQTLELVVRPAQAAADLDISSPAIRKLTAAMEARHSELKPYFDSGAIGLTADGMVDIREPAGVPLAERNRLRKLVADDNADRAALYREIASANGHPEWETEIRQTFARRWIDRAPQGWWYRGGDGWRRK